VRALPNCDFWPDTASYADIDLAHVRGHRQVTDAYLARLAQLHGGVLATFDEGLVASLPDCTVLVGAED
jgi:predicted nucleic acid-binding protein